MDTEIKGMLEEILSIVKNLEQRALLMESNAMNVSAEHAETHAIPTKRISLKEFLLHTGPANGVQTTLAIAYYLEKYENVAAVNAADIEKGFRSAKEPVPSNINDKMNMCVKNGHLMEAEEKKSNMKAWTVTRTGEQVVERGFQKDR